MLGGNYISFDVVYWTAFFIFFIYYTLSDWLVMHFGDDWIRTAQTSVLCGFVDGGVVTAIVVIWHLISKTEKVIYRK